MDTIVRWVVNGAPEGDPRDLPSPKRFLEGWSIPKPDLVIQLPKPFPIPATGVVEYQKIIVPSGFTEDKWIQFAEARPDQRSRVHHMIAYIREPGSRWLRGAPVAPVGEFFVAPKQETTDEDTSALPSDFLVGCAQGQPPEILKAGQAKLIKAGSDFVLEVHYTTNGTAAMEQSKFGFVFAKKPPELRVLTLSSSNGKFRIPPAAPLGRSKLG